MKWIQENWLPLTIIILVIVIFIVYLIYKCKKSSLRQVALDAILFAEKHYDTTSGKERLNLAVKYVYEFLPLIVRILLPVSAIEFLLNKLIQKTFDETKSLLDYHKEVK
jgi:hypothetical protein